MNQSSRDILIDDFTRNLYDWTLKGVTGIKVLNGINSTHGTWHGCVVRSTAFTESIVMTVKGIAMAVTAA